MTTDDTERDWCLPHRREEPCPLCAIVRRDKAARPRRLWADDEDSRPDPDRG